MVNIYYNILNYGYLKDCPTPLLPKIKPVSFSDYCSFDDSYIVFIFWRFLRDKVNSKDLLPLVQRGTLNLVFCDKTRALRPPQ